jgi:uncharacterized protein YegL
MTERKLAATLMKVVKRTSNKTQFCLYLFDGSGSVAPQNFSGPLKESVQALANYFSDAMHCAVQFSGEVRLECPPTKNVQQLINAVKAMKQMRSGTHTAAAFDKALELTRTYNQNQYSMTIFLLTDGMPSEGCSPESQIRQLKALGVEIFVLGIGDPNILPEATLQSWSSAGNAFNIDDYAALLRAITSLKDEASANAENLIEIYAEPLETQLLSGTSLPLKLNVHALQLSTPIPAGTQINFRGNAYYNPIQVVVPNNVTVDTPWEGKVTFRVKAGAQDDDFPGQIGFEFKIKLPGGVVIEQEGALTLATGFLRGDFETKTPVNVLMFGFPGSGKSALGNSIMTCLGLAPVPNYFLVTAKKATHVTTNYQRVRAFLSHHYPPTPPDLDGSAHQGLYPYKQTPTGIGKKSSITSL